MKVLKMCFLVLIFGCDNTNNRIEEKVETSANNVQTKMTADVLKAKEVFAQYYKTSQNNGTDATNRKIENFYTVFTKTINYIDSVKTETSTLDNMDLNNVNVIKQMFLDSGTGDSLYNKLQFTYSLAQDIALTDIRKNEIKQIASNSLMGLSSTKWKEQNFGRNNSLGATMMLYGFESELFKAGIKSLEGYQK